MSIHGASAIGYVLNHRIPHEMLYNTPAKWLRNVVLPTGGDSAVVSLAAAPVVEQIVEGTEGVKIDGEKKKKKGVEEAEVTDTPVASKKHKAEEVKDVVEGESTEKKKKKKKKEAEEVVVSNVDKYEKKKKKKEKG